jgi:hypothetical protein
MRGQESGTYPASAVDGRIHHLRLADGDRHDPNLRRCVRTMGSGSAMTGGFLVVRAHRP